MFCLLAACAVRAVGLPDYWSLVPGSIQRRKSRVLCTSITPSRPARGSKQNSIENRTSKAGIDNERKQILIEPRPVADRPIERWSASRAPQRPDASLGHPYMRKRAALAFLRVSGQEIVRVLRPFRMLDVRDGLG